jgi:hypothetical protein
MAVGVHLCVRPNERADTPKVIWGPQVCPYVVCFERTYERGLIDNSHRLGTSSEKLLTSRWGAQGYRLEIKGVLLCQYMY